MVVRLPGNASIKDEGKSADTVKAEAAKLKFDNASIVTTGAPVLLQNVNDYLTGGMLTLGAIAIGVMALILLILFSVRWRLLALLVVVIGVIWAFGIVGYLGIPLTIVTIAGLPVMLGIGIDYAIQMHARVEEEVVVDRADHPIQETSRNLGPALLVVTFDAIFAFSALYFAKVPMLRQFGLLARGRRRHDLHQQHRRAPGHPRHPRVQVAHEAQGLPRRTPRPTRGVARCDLVEGRRRPRRRRAS